MRPSSAGSRLCHAHRRGQPAVPDKRPSWTTSVGLAAALLTTMALPAGASQGLVITGTAVARAPWVLSIDGQDLRLWGISPPPPDCKFGAGEEALRCRELATLVLEAILATGALRCRRQSANASGTAVARCEQDGADVAAMLVLAGVALDAPAESRGFYAPMRRRRVRLGPGYGGMPVRAEAYRPKPFMNRFTPFAPDRTARPADMRAETAM